MNKFLYLVTLTISMFLSSKGFSIPACNTIKRPPITGGGSDILLSFYLNGKRYPLYLNTSTKKDLYSNPNRSITPIGNSDYHFYIISGPSNITLYAKINGITKSVTLQNANSPGSAEWNFCL